MSLPLAVEHAEWLVMVEEVDRLVKPWLRSGDQWRHGPNGWPLLEDSLVAWSRLTGSRYGYGSRVGDWSLSLRGSTWSIAANYSDSEGEGYEVEEAATRLLLSTLKRVCAACKQWDGHDWLCPVTLAEKGWSREQAIRERDAEHERVFGGFVS